MDYPGTGSAAINGEKALEIVTLFGKIVRDNPAPANPLSKLPYSKDNIKEAIRIIFLITEINYQQGKDSKDHYTEMKETLKSMYIHLATFIADNDARLLRAPDESRHRQLHLLHKRVEEEIRRLRKEVKNLLDNIKAEVQSVLVSRAH